jgi:hypothetical protein
MTNNTYIGRFRLGKLRSCRGKRRMSIYIMHSPSLIKDTTDASDRSPVE